MPKLSVITINYNNRDGLKKTIESVVNQTCRDFEYIVIDGGSTDGSVDVIKEYADKIDYWVSEPDKGIYNAMNKGIDVAKGEYCIFMNSGDVFFSNDVYNEVYEDLRGGDIISGNLVFDIGGVWLSPEKADIPLFYSKNTLPHMATFIKTSWLKRYKYDENYRYVSDWKFFTQVLIYDRALYKSIRKNICIFDTNGISSIHKEQCEKEIINILETEFSKNVLCYYMDNAIDWDSKLYNTIRETKYRNLFYVLNVSIVKLFSLFQRKSWTKKFPLLMK